MPAAIANLRTGAQRTFTLAEYFEREARAKHKHFFLNGKILPVPGSKFRHNLIASNLIAALKTALRPLDKKYLVINSDQKILVERLNLVYYADALVVCEKPEFWQGREDVITNPILIVEVLSKGTRRFDKGEKFMDFQELPSLREYVLVEQNLMEVETWFRLAPNTWEKSVAGQPSVELRSLGIELPMAEIYENTGL